MGVDAWEQGFLRLDPTFAYAEASFLMTFAMGGVPHAGSRHLGISNFLEKNPCQLLGASMRNSAHGKGHEEGGFGIRKGGIEPQETSCSRASTPQTRVCFMLSPIPLTLRGTDPLPPLSEKELTYSSKSIKIPGPNETVNLRTLKFI